MNNSNKPQAQEDRQADLYYAFQFGYATVRQADSDVLKAEFDQKFGDDPEAVAQFQAGVRHERVKREELGMTPDQYHAHHEAKKRAFHERQEAIHAASLGR
ncbi:hypothetical protein [Halomonas sp. I5-271120]|uniref:hypothetical protein n=1 Tax=Halomonas sp. I5-271120 TaxID=3061632 RepID=UPI0027152BDE|nr:hypothetical protein [Halomonas sp. I5-271120]